MTNYEYLQYCKIYEGEVLGSTLISYLKSAENQVPIYHQKRNELKEKSTDDYLGILWERIPFEITFASDASLTEYSGRGCYLNFLGNEVHAEIIGLKVWNESNNLAKMLITYSPGSAKIQQYIEFSTRDSYMVQFLPRARKIVVEKICR